MNISNYYYYIRPLYWVAPVADTAALLRSHGKVSTNTLKFWLSIRPRVSTL